MTEHCCCWNKEKQICKFWKQKDKRPAAWTLGLLTYLFRLQVNNMMWQFQMQQFEQLNEAFSKPLQRQFSAGHSGHGDSSHRRYHPSQMNRGQHYGDEQGSARQQHSHGQDKYHQNDRSGGRHHDNKGGNRHYDDRGNNLGHREWRRYWVLLGAHVFFSTLIWELLTKSLCILRSFIHDLVNKIN